MNKNGNDRLQQNISYTAEDFRIYAVDKTAGVSDRAFHEAVEIKYVYEGTVMQMIDSEMIIAKEGTITVMNPYELHANMETERYHGKYFLIMVDLDFFVSNNPTGTDLRELLLTKGQTFRHEIHNHPRMQQIIRDVVRELEEQKEHYRLMVYHLMSELFTLLLRDALTPENSRILSKEGLRRSHLLAPALSKIFKDYDRHISIDELAGLCNVSKYHFCRLFKEEMGVTAVEYITRHRISLAEVLLREGRKSIEEIAYQCGFEDIGYFYRCYKKIKGTSPKKEYSIKKA